jgi:hypothetical protein
MVQYKSRFTGGLTVLVLSFAASLFLSTAAISQTLPHLRTTFVARNTLQPDPCFEFACFNRSAYDRNTLAAIGAGYPAVYVFLRISAGPWYEQAVLQNRSTLLPGYTAAGYRYPVEVIGDDILATAYQTGAGLPDTCATHVFGRTDTRWQVKQVIDVCPTSFARDGNRVLIGTAASMPIYARGSNGLFAEESRVFPPSPGFFADARKVLALNAWTVVVGKPLVNSETGAAYIFQRRSGAWQLLKTLTPEGGGTYTHFGAAVDVYEYNVAIGAPGAINPSGMGRGLVYMYTGVNDTWFMSQQIAEPLESYNDFGAALALRGRRLVVSTGSPNPLAGDLRGYLFERGLRESAWDARASLAGNGFTVDLSGSTVMIDNKGLRIGSFPTVVNLPALREPDVAP